MDLTQDTDSAYSLNTYKTNPIYNQITFFASAVIKKNDVSYYLMPVYMYPELLNGISEELRKRMQGKSCFHFNQIDEALFRELNELTRSGYTKYKEENLI